jgi:hypothetical protein
LSNICDDDTCAPGPFGVACRSDADCESDNCANEICGPGYYGSPCSGDAGCYSHTCNNGACTKSELGEGCAVTNDCQQGSCSLGECSVGPECNAAVAVDMGETGTPVTTTVSGCLKVQADYPDWWGTSRRMSLQVSAGGAYPLPLRIFNECSNLGQTLTFTADWQQLLSEPTSAECPTLLDLRGTANANVTLVYFGG